MHYNIISFITELSCREDRRTAPKNDITYSKNNSPSIIPRSHCQRINIRRRSIYPEIVDISPMFMQKTKDMNKIIVKCLMHRKSFLKNNDKTDIKLIKIDKTKLMHELNANGKICNIVCGAKVL